MTDIAIFPDSCPIERFDNVVELPNGLRVIGREDVNFPEAVYEFLSVPYATPPVGKKRFEETLPFPDIIGFSGRLIWNGTDNMNSCIQPEKALNDTRQSESCLFLNVYTPRGFQANSKKYPVLVYFHAGGFMAGSSAMNSGAELTARLA